MEPRAPLARSPFLWSARTDALAFGGPAVVALTLAALAAFVPGLHLRGPLPPWAWIAFVLLVDVAHVHTTLFRTYLDREELRRRRALYALSPLAVYAAGVALHARSSILFWRVLAYVAVFHFVRQQVGWVSICRARARETDRAGRLFDHAVVYVATLYPIVYWHANLPRAFHWFDDDDFVAWPGLAPVVPFLGAAHLALLVAYLAREGWMWRARGGFTSWGKHLVVLSTAALWYTGIVATNDDFTFTVTNVLGHGVPYFVLLWRYASARAAESASADSPSPRPRTRTLIAALTGAGVLGFLVFVFALAFVEEAFWDRLVWHQRPWLFGGVASESPLFSPLVRALVVPLLSVPQATHYVLDAVLWRRRDTGPAQAAALGFRSA
ncbi:MAG: hypothetical protein R3B70_31840 [Polyangiaceae bacterium]